MLRDACRRSAPRAHFHQRVELGVHLERRSARARDLSPGGLGLELSAPHPLPGLILESEFALPGFAVAIEVPVMVVWSDPRAGRLGLAFQDVDPGVAELFARYVEERL